MGDFQNLKILHSFDLSHHRCYYCSCCLWLLVLAEYGIREKKRTYFSLKTLTPLNDSDSAGFGFSSLENIMSKNDLLKANELFSTALLIVRKY